MAKKYAEHIAGPTPQSEPIPGRDMEKNAAGGFSFKLDRWARLQRFLIIGSEGGSYYATEKSLTIENSDNIRALIGIDGHRVVKAALDVSVNNLAPKNDPAIFVLALASILGDKSVRKAAFDAMPQVCRIGTHLFSFCEYRQTLGGGWGRGMCDAIENWYTSKTPEKLVHDALKYRQREGWTHRDVLRLAHPGGDDAHKEIYDAICRPEGGVNRFQRGKDAPSVFRGKSGGWEALSGKYPLVEGFIEAESAGMTATPDHDHVGVITHLVEKYRLERELIPTQYLNQKAVQEAMIPSLGYTALLRNLGNMARSGLLVPMSEAVKAVVAKLSNVDALRKARVHPYQVLLAARMYAGGQGMRSKGEGWTAVPQLVDCLDEVFEKSFGNIPSTGKRFLLGIDVSGSMRGRPMGSPLTAAEAAAAFAMVTLRTEPEYYALGFADLFRDLGLTAKDSLQDVLRKTSGMNFGGTDCAIPVLWALEHKVPVDVFAVYSDGESWAGNVHVNQALAQYRKQMGIPSKLAMVNFTASAHTLADPDDALQMNLIGFDASLPQALAAFVME